MRRVSLRERGESVSERREEEAVCLRAVKDRRTRYHLKSNAPHSLQLLQCSVDPQCASQRESPCSADTVATEAARDQKNAKGRDSARGERKKTEVKQTRTCPNFKINKAGERSCEGKTKGLTRA